MISDKDVMDFKEILKEITISEEIAKIEGIIKTLKCCQKMKIEELSSKTKGYFCYCEETIETVELIGKIYCVQCGKVKR